MKVAWGTFMVAGGNPWLPAPNDSPEKASMINSVQKQQQNQQHTFNLHTHFYDVIN